MSQRGISVEQALQLRSESKHLEFKEADNIDNLALKLKVIRAMLAMANNQDGGTIILGIADDGSQTGCSDDVIKTWAFEDVSEQVSKYADPYVTFDLEVREFESRKFIRIYVDEFESVPIICKKDGSYADGKIKSKDVVILKAGTTYVRSRKKPESVPIPSQTEMRELLDLAIEKGLRRTIQLMKISGGLEAKVENIREISELQYKKQVGQL